MAPELKEEWETPGLWPRIATAMETEPARRTMWWGKSWKLHSAVAAAAVLVIAVLLRHSEVTAPPPLPASKEFLTAETFGDIERTRAAYVQAIEKLAAAAGHGLESSSTPLAAVYREKILLLDSAIADLKSGVKENPYNVYLQNQLALLYQEKEKTLKEWLENEKNN